MSFESLLLAIVFIVLPLIEMFRGAAQRRQEQSSPEPPRKRRAPEGPPPEAMQRQVPPEPMRVPDAAVPDVPIIAVPDRRVVTSGERLSHRSAAGTRTGHAAVSSPSAAGRREARAILGVIAGLRSPGGVQRAMVAMTILGPCRALNPYGWRETDSLL